MTNEKPAKRSQGKIQGAYKIPDVCEYYRVECISPQEFLRRQGWNF